jgi:hypothetical protein
MLGAYAFSEPALLASKLFLPFPGVYVLYLKNPVTGYMKIWHIGESGHLSDTVTFAHPVVQQMMKEAGGNKELLYFAYHIALSEEARQRIVVELSQRTSRSGLASRQSMVRHLTPSFRPAERPNEKRADFLFEPDAEKKEA